MEAMLSKFVELLKSSPRVYFVLTLAGVLVVCPSRFQQKAGLDQLRSHYLPWFTLGTIIFGTLLLISIYDKVNGHIRARRKVKQQVANQVAARVASSEKIRSLIQALAFEERLVLALFVGMDQQTIELSTLDEVVDRLVTRGLLIRFNSLGFRAAYQIKTPIFEFLRNNQSLIRSELSELEKIHKRAQ